MEAFLVSLLASLGASAGAALLGDAWEYFKASHEDWAHYLLDEVRSDLKTLPKGIEDHQILRWLTGDGVRLWLTLGDEKSTEQALLSLMEIFVDESKTMLSPKEARFHAGRIVATAAASVLLASGDQEARHVAGNLRKVASFEGPIDDISNRIDQLMDGQNVQDEDLTELLEIARRLDDVEFESVAQGIDNKLAELLTLARSSHKTLAVISEDEDGPPKNPRIGDRPSWDALLRSREVASASRETNWPDGLVGIYELGEPPKFVTLGLRVNAAYVVAFSTAGPPPAAAVVVEFGADGSSRSLTARRMSEPAVGQGALIDSGGWLFKLVGAASFMPSWVDPTLNFEGRTELDGLRVFVPCLGFGEADRPSMLEGVIDSTKSSPEVRLLGADVCADVEHVGPGVYSADGSLLGLCSLSDESPAIGFIPASNSMLMNWRTLHIESVRGWIALLSAAVDAESRKSMCRLLSLASGAPEESLLVPLRAEVTIDGNRVVTSRDSPENWPSIGILVGASGSGKTTAGLELARTAIEEFLNLAEEELLSNLSPLPFWVRAAELIAFVEAGDKSLGSSLLRFVIANCPTEANAVCEHLLRGTVVLIVDDLNTLSQDGRDQLRRLAASYNAERRGAHAREGRILFTSVAVGDLRVGQEEYAWRVRVLPPRVGEVREIGSTVVTAVVANRSLQDASERAALIESAIVQFRNSHLTKRLLWLHYILLLSTHGKKASSWGGELAEQVLEELLWRRFGSDGAGLIEDLANVTYRVLEIGGLWSFSRGTIRQACQLAEVPLEVLERSGLITGLETRSMNRDLSFDIKDLANYLAARGTIAALNGAPDSQNLRPVMEQFGSLQYMRDYALHLIGVCPGRAEQIVGAVSKRDLSTAAEVAESLQPYVGPSAAESALAAIAPALVKGATEVTDRMLGVVGELERDGSLLDNPKFADLKQDAAEFADVSNVRTLEGLLASVRQRAAIRTMAPKTTTVVGVLPWRRESVRIENDLTAIVTAYRRVQPGGSINRIQRAYRLAAELHGEQRRKSGESYISHPLAVAKVVAEFGLDDVAISAALLHDAVEDTAVSLDKITEEFGDEVANLVDGVTKLERVHFDSKDNQQAASVRKMMIAIAQDVRALIIKLADRLHNLQTIASLPPWKQERTARETLEIYAPLAHRLGMRDLERQLEDLAFAATSPQDFAELGARVAEQYPDPSVYIPQLTGLVESVLGELKIPGTVIGRQKHLYSIYRELVDQNANFDELHSLVRVRVIVESVRDCYAVLGSIHSAWKPVQGHFKDFIAMPKFNTYQSLHTTVIGPLGKEVEVQIRTAEMHARAENGVAANWGDKETASDQETAWLNRIVEFDQETPDPSAFMTNLKTNLDQDEVFVFSPKGKVIEMDVGATPVDFAYQIHTEVGERCTGARVNGRLVPLDTRLQSGDRVEIITSKNPDAGPSKDWLNFVVSKKATKNIRRWFHREHRAEFMQLGRDELMSALLRADLPMQLTMKGDLLREVCDQLNYMDVDSLLVALGQGRVLPRTIIKRVRRGYASGESTNGQLEPVVQQRPKDLIGLDGNDRPQNMRSIAVEVHALDRPRLLYDVSAVLAAHKINVASVVTRTGPDRVSRMQFNLELADTTYLEFLLSALLEVESVYYAARLSAADGSA